jgi:cation diffusion facilitator CzcD-associated flavoprotein CzcO
VIGAGPYGLSISAHLSARGVEHEIFGDTMDLWVRHMPLGMYLKSEGFASNISEPSGHHTLERFCAEHGIEYGELAVPIALDTFERYGRWFQERLVARARPTRVEDVRLLPDGFELRLSTGEALRAGRVVVATGVGSHAYLPSALRGLPPEALVHTYDYRDPARSRGVEVAVVGAGQSALETAALMGEHGADVRVIARTSRIAWNSKPGGSARPLRARLRYPESGLGEGRSQRFYANHPLAFHFAPLSKRMKHAYTALGPAGAWWLRPRVEDCLEVLVGRTLVGAEARDGQVSLRLEGPSGTEELVVAQVVAGTGYRPDLNRLAFLDPPLRAGIAAVAGTPVLDRFFQSSVPGLHFVGFPAGLSFGPVMRFVCGTDFAARRVAGACAR